ncbi:MAG: zf-HC2 domain-containing protein [Chloroherpetonaceae bacterium]
MTCKEAQALISAAVDGELDDATMREFLITIEKCEHCRAEYEAELQTKKLLREKLKRVKAPQSLVDAITRQTIERGKPSTTQFNALAAQPSTAELSKPGLESWKRAFLEAIYINPNFNSKAHPIFAVALGTCILAMLIFASFVREERNVFDAPSYLEAGTPSNIFDATSRLFVESQSPDVKTKDASVIANHIEKVLGTSPVIPVVRSFQPSSVRVAAFGSADVGEVRFVHNKDPKTIVAVYIARENDVLKNATVENDVMRYISENGRNFYRKTCPSGSQVVVWKWGEIIYMATTNNPDINLLTDISNPYWVN